MEAKLNQHAINPFHCTANVFSTTNTCKGHAVVEGRYLPDLLVIQFVYQVAFVQQTDRGSWCFPPTMHHRCNYSSAMFVLWSWTEIIAA